MPDSSYISYMSLILLFTFLLRSRETLATKIMQHYYVEIVRFHNFFFFWAYISLIWYYKLHHKFNVSARWVKFARNLLTFLKNIEFYFQEEILFFSYVLLQHIIMKSSKKPWSQFLITSILAVIFQILYCTVY